MKVLIVGFPYIRSEYFETFKFYPEKDKILFLLPKIWKAKDGKVIFHPPKDQNVFITNAFFYHSHYPFVGGLLKGWMPALPLFLFKKSKEIGLVYSCSEPHLLTTLYNGIWTRLAGKKHVVFTWENIPYWQKFHGPKWWFKRIIIKLNLMLANGIVCGNKKGEAIYKKITSKPVAVIPMNGVDPNFFHRQDGNERFDGHDWSDRIVFTFVGAIGYRKGIHLILEAFPGVLQQIPSAHLVIAGSGEDDAKINDLIQKLNLPSHVTRLTWIDHGKLIQLLSVSDIFLYPSIPYGGWEEQFGYAMVEASLMELPIISTRTGSIEEVIKDGETGILIESNNIEQLRDAMVKLGQDYELRKRFGENGRKYIIDNFSHQIIAQKFHRFFESLN